MALVPTGLATSRAQQEHGKRCVAACVHPRRRTMFLVAGQVVDEIDLRDGSLVYRIISDLVDPIVRLEVTTSDRGHEYLLLLSAASELRIWDIEGRFHLAGVSLSAPPPANRGRALPVPLAPVSTWTVSNFHNRCILLFSRAGSSHVEALHVQRQVDKPGAHTVMEVLESKAATSKMSCVTSISAHGSMPLVAVGTSDGVISVFSCPWFSDADDLAAASSSGGNGEAAPSLSKAAESGASVDEDDDLEGGAKSKQKVTATLKKPVTVATAVEPRSMTLFVAAVSPDIISLQGRLRKQSVLVAMKAAAVAGQPPASVPTESYYDMVTATAWHPILPLLAATDGTGRIVVWRIGVVDGLHSVVSSRDWCTTPIVDNSPRIITSLMFHPSLPRLLSLSYAPQAASEAPLIQAWCTAHATLPPLPPPASPALSAMMETAASDPAAQGVAHMTQAPAILSGPSAAAALSPVVWVAGCAIPVCEVTTSSRAISVTNNDQDSEMGLGSHGEDSASLHRTPLVPFGATGVAYGSPVVDVVSAPRSWFVSGGEGQGFDSADNTDVLEQEDSSKNDDLGSGSLAEFAARLTSSAGASKSKAEASRNQSSDPVSSNKFGLPKRQSPAEVPLSIDAVLYIQGKVQAAGDPPRVAVHHALHIRPLGQSAAADDESIAASQTGSKRPGSESAVPSKRLCWLPAYGPGGPLLPLSIQRSPSGRYLLIKFAYLTEVKPGQSEDDAASSEKTALATFRQAQGIIHASRKKKGKPDGHVLADGSTHAGDGVEALASTGGSNPGIAMAAVNSSIGAASDCILFVIVGPLSNSIDADSGAPKLSGKGSVQDANISFQSLSKLPTDVPVGLMTTAVAATLLVGDRLLMVRRPAHAAVGGAAATEHVVTIEPLDHDATEAEAAESARRAAQPGKGKSKIERDFERLGQTIKANAQKDFAKIKAGFDQLGDKMKANAEKDLTRLKSFFGVKSRDKAQDASKTGPELEGHPSDAGLTEGLHAEGDVHGHPRQERPPVRFAVHDAVTQVLPTPFHSPVSSARYVEEPLHPDRPVCMNEHPASGDVLLYCSLWSHPDDSAVGLRQDRTVLRYSNNAFGQYDEGNPHGYAMVDAYVPTAPPSLAKTWREEQTLEAWPVGHGALESARDRSGTSHSGEGPSGGRSRGNTMVISKQLSSGSLGSVTQSAEEAWAEHTSHFARCPVAIRPALVLAPGEQVIRITWQASEAVWGDAGTHDSAVDHVFGLSKKDQKATAKIGLPPKGPSKGDFDSTSAKTAQSQSHQPVREAVQQTLPAAIASGGPLIALLTTHRLLIVTPALQLLVALPTFAPVSGSVGAGLGHVCPAWATRGDYSASALSCASFGVWRGMYATPHGHGHGFGTAAAGNSAVASAHPSPLPEESGDDAGSSDEAVVENNYNEHSQMKEVALGAGYIGVVNSIAVLPLAASPGTIRNNSAIVAEQARRAVLALPVAMTRFGLPPNGLAPPDSSATFVGGVQANTVASAAAGAERMTLPRPVTRLSDTIPHDDVSDEIVSATCWRSPIVSHAWAGSALLFTTMSGEVWYVTPLGRARRLASLEHWVKDATIVCAAADRLVFAASNGRTSRVQVRSRAFAPLEPLIAASLDHSATRPRPLLAMLGSAGSAAGQKGEGPPHPVVAALAHTLAVSLVYYSPAVGKLGPSVSQPRTSAELVVLTGQPAIAGTAFAALARDYCFVRDAVVRYGHAMRDSHVTASASAAVSVRRRDGGGSSWGVTRVVASALEERGLLDLAFFVSQGSPNGADKFHDTAGPPVGNDDTPSAWLPWLDESGQRKKASVFPWHARSMLSVKRGRLDHAVWALSSEDPALASTLVLLTKHRAGSGAGLDALSEYDPASVRLPSPFSPLAGRLRVLGRIMASAGHLRGSLLCFDVAGDYSASLSVLCLASSTAVLRVARASVEKRRAPRGLDDEDADEHRTNSGAVPGIEGSLSVADVDAALGALLGPAKDRFPAIALAAALRRRAIIDDDALAQGRDMAQQLAARAAQRALLSAKPSVDDDESGSAGDMSASFDDGDDARLSERDYDNEEDGDGNYDARDPALDSASMLESLRAAIYPPAADNRSARAEALLPFDFSIGSSAAAVAQQSRKMLDMHALSAAPALAHCPYLPLIDGTLASLLKAGEESGKRLVHSIDRLHVPAPSAVMEAKLVVCGGTVDPTPADLLADRHAPMALDSIQRWLGTAIPAVSKAAGSAAGASGEDGDDGDDGGAFGMSLEGILGLGGGQVKEIDFLEAAKLSAQGKRKLRALARGAEDAVVGYWRFDRGDAESAAEASRLKDLRKGKNGPAGSPTGIWGFFNGASAEPLSPWHASPIPDLSRQALHGCVFDALFLLSRIKGPGVAAKDAAAGLAQTLARSTAADVSELQPFLRLAWGQYDAPCDPGEPGKVREPRALVAGVGTVVDAAGGKAAAMIKSAAKVPLHRLPAGTVGGSGPPGLEPVPLTPSLRLLSTLHAWAVVVPTPRYSYSEVGVRPWDAVTAAWTLECWVKVGSPYAGTGPTRAQSRGDEDGGDEQSGPQAQTEEGEEGAATGISLDREVTIASRAELRGQGSESTIRTQWQLMIKPNGALAFMSFPHAVASPNDAPSAFSPATSSVTSPAGVVSFGVWSHVAVVVDGTAAAKEVAARLKAAGAAADKHGPNAPTATPSDAPLPPAVARLFVDGIQSGEGPITCGLPLPLVIDEPLGGSAAGPPADLFLIAPDFVGRLAEVRVWAKKRTGTELTDTRDFHLDSAETARKARMAINIRPATLPAAVVSSVPGVQTKVVETFDAATTAVALRRQVAGPPGLPLPSIGLSGAPIGPGRRRIAAAGPIAGSSDGTTRPSPLASADLSPAVITPTPTPLPADDSFDTGFTTQPVLEHEGVGASAVALPTSSYPENGNAEQPSGMRLGTGKIGMSAQGGLTAPPPGVGGGKKAALLRQRAAATTDTPPS